MHYEGTIILMRTGAYGTVKIYIKIKKENDQIVLDFSA